MFENFQCIKMTFYKYWLLKDFNNLDIDIINTIKSYCQIELYEPVLYHDFYPEYQNKFLYESRFHKLHSYIKLVEGKMEIGTCYKTTRNKYNWLIIAQGTILNPKYLNPHIDNDIKYYAINAKSIKVKYDGLNKDGLYVFKENIRFIYDPT